MDSRRARLIAEVIKHLESMDGEALKSELAPPAATEEAIVVEEPTDKGPMEALAAKEGGAPELEDEEMDDEDLEELAKLGG